MKKCLKFLKLFVILLLTPLIVTQTYSINKSNKKSYKKAGQSITAKRRSRAKKCENNKIESMTVDCAFSIGGYCTCARHLENNKLRRTTSPIDWMITHSLDGVAHLFETKFSDFFEKFKVIESKDKVGNRKVWDTKNNVESIHFMPYSIPFHQAYKEFKEKMKERAQKVDDIISSSKSIVLVNCRQHPHKLIYETTTDRELKKFAGRFAKAYPNLKKIYLIDIQNNNSNKINKRIVFQNNKFKIIQYKFKNIDNKNFHPNWLGNKTAWNEIMKHIRLTDPEHGYAVNN